jgi:glutaminase
MPSSVKTSLNVEALKLSPIQSYLEQLHDELSEITGGELANYIPELTHADPAWLGIALATVDGHVYQVGDSRQKFTIQSISKALTYGLALEDRGLDYVLSKVGVEPSGEAFNSISLEPGTGRPLNPMINAGAIATTGLIEAHPDAPPMARILNTFARYAGRPLEIDDKVYRSESETGHRNRAIAHLLYGHCIVDRTPEEVLDLYFRQCSILVTARDLAMMGACLANNGVNPVTGVIAIKSRYVDKVLSVMSTCGMYDYSGGWVFHVGMPAKSGVGGGIMAVLPGQFGLGVFSPLLDAKGNSVRGVEACKRLSNDFSLHLFNVTRSTSTSVIRRHYDCARFPSRRRRNAAEIEALAREGHRIGIYELQGELMVGSAESVAYQMLTALPELDVLVVDFRRVVGMDRASILVLSELCPHAARQGKRLFFTECRHLYRLKKHVQSRGESALQDPGWLQFDDTDRAVEWCENDLLARVGAHLATNAAVTDLAQQYLCSGMTVEELEAVRNTATERRFAAGERIISAGDPADCFYFVITGEVEVSINTSAGKKLRLTTMGPGTVFGEVGLFNQNRRTADVWAISDAVCLEVRLDALDSPIRTQMLVNMASHFARKIEHDTDLIQHLG